MRRMKKIVIAVLIAIAVFLAISWLKLPAEQSISNKPVLAATIPPLADIVKNIAGDRFEVVTILPSGASPHTFDLGPTDIKRLSQAKVVFAIGHDLDAWVAGISQAQKDLPVITVDQGINLRPSVFETEEPEDPHYWLSIENAKIISQNIAQELSNLDPVNQQEYLARAADYQQELSALKQEINDLLEPLKQRKLITFHESFNYFAAEYNLEVVGVFELAPGKEPTPQYLVSLQNSARQHKITAVFSEPQLSPDVIRPFVQDLGLELFILDPEGGVPGRESYFDLMRYNAQIIAQALGK